MHTTPSSIAIIGAGPGGLFMFKRLLEQTPGPSHITVFEKTNRLGAGLPYSQSGASHEHLTNVSGNEIPELVTSLSDWVNEQDKNTIKSFGIDPDKFHEYKVIPRLLFGRYLSHQFSLLIRKAAEQHIAVELLLNTQVTDLRDNATEGTVSVETKDGERYSYDAAVICSGHFWPHKWEGKIPGYFDSPYPPAKLNIITNHPVALKGSSLTAIDAIRTLARSNGRFVEGDGKKLTYHINKGSEQFKMVMHSRSGLLPAVRFHLDDAQLHRGIVITEEELQQQLRENGGFLSLDFVFERSFKEGLKDQWPLFYESIKNMSMEAFVENMMSYRENMQAFDLLKREYKEAAESIRKEESIYWKEMLAALSFSLNYPAKYFSAEDTRRLHQVLMPLISIVIAFVPQGSVEEMLALHDAGVLEIESVGEDSSIDPCEQGGAVVTYTRDGRQYRNSFKVFVDCVGQPHLSMEDLPYPSLVKEQLVKPATIKFKDPEVGRNLSKAGDDKINCSEGECLLSVPGITINDNFQLINRQGIASTRLYIMAVPFIGGYNPDYSGLDFGHKTSGIIAAALFEPLRNVAIYNKLK